MKGLTNREILIKIINEQPELLENYGIIKEVWKEPHLDQNNNEILINVIRHDNLLYTHLYTYDNNKFIRDDLSIIKKSFPKTHKDHIDIYNAIVYPNLLNMISKYKLDSNLKINENKFRKEKI